MFFARLLAYGLLLIPPTMGTFTETLQLRTTAFADRHIAQIPYISVRRMEEGTSATNLHLGHFAGMSERLLVTPIIDSGSLVSAISEWCQNSTQATKDYGDISTWYVGTVGHQH